MKSHSFQNPPPTAQGAFGLLLLFLALSPSVSQARPSIRDAFFQNYPSAVGSVLDTVPSAPGHCGVCHYKFAGRDLRNPYGIAVGNNGANSNAVWLIRLQDSDGDGFSNLEEITNTITPQGRFRAEFLSRPGLSYTIEFRDSLTSGSWTNFVTDGTFTATNTLSSFDDDFTTNSSGGPSSTGQRYYRFQYTAP